MMALKVQALLKGDCTLFLGKYNLANCGNSLPSGCQLSLNSRGTSVQLRSALYEKLC